MNTIGKRLAQARHIAGLQQKQLAAESGLDQASLSKIERDLQPDSAKLLRGFGVIVEMLRVDFVWLATGKRGAGPIPEGEDKFPGREAAVRFARAAGYSDEAIDAVRNHRPEPQADPGARVWLNRIERIDEKLAEKAS